MTVYLDNAATTFPKPSCVAEECSKCINEYCGNPGRGSHSLSLAASEAIYEARAKLNSFFNGYSPETCVFTLNTTYALNTALKALAKRGDRVLISDMEHNSVYRQVVALKDAGVIDFDIFTTFNGDEEKICRDIVRKITPNTSLIVCQHSSNICGITLPVRKIGSLCRKYKLKFIADAAQSAGILDIDIRQMNIDALCVPSHKGLYGPQGAGAVLFSERVSSDLNSFIEGGSGSNSLDPHMPQMLPDRLEAGTMPTPAIAGLSSAIDYISSIGIKNIREYETELSAYLTNELLCDRNVTVYCPEKTSGIVLFNVKGISSAKVSEEFDRIGICTRAGFHCAPLAHGTLGTGSAGAVRASFGIFNEKRDVSKLLDALYKIEKSI